jgi:hypothetical protein
VALPNSPPTGAYVHGLRGADDVDLPLVRAVGEVESEVGGDVGFGISIGALGAAVTSVTPRRRSRPASMTAERSAGYEVATSKKV